MNTILIVAREELRYWSRANLIGYVVVVFLMTLIAVSVLNTFRIQAETSERDLHQAESEQTFLDQPDRHPHRMVHYGHYIFRAPVPLAIFDPGLDSVTGQSMFLEGHRQNSATFSSLAASANLGGLSWLTPAIIYQVFAPLLIILLGHGAMVREREAKTLAPMLAQGMQGHQIMAGKVLALSLFVLLLLVPLTFCVLLSLGSGESLLAIATLVGVYFLYLSVWSVLTVLVSSVFKNRSSVMAALAVFWLVLTLVLPSIAVNVASSLSPIKGRIETELAMLEDLKDLTDGHSVSASDLEQVRTDLFSEYGVDQIEDLPINIRGVLAQKSEEMLTAAMNTYADRRMAAELHQSGVLSSHGWLTPMLALSDVSRTISGTDLEHYHRFLRHAEALRYAFVQGLNQVHVEKLSYIDDINRNKDQESFDRTRMDSANWQLLDEFRFEASSASERIKQAGPSIVMLVVWMIVLSILSVYLGRRIRI